MVLTPPHKRSIKETVIRHFNREPPTVTWNRLLCLPYKFACSSTPPPFSTPDRNINPRPQYKLVIILIFFSFLKIVTSERASSCVREGVVMHVGFKIRRFKSFSQMEFRWSGTSFSKIYSKTILENSQNGHKFFKKKSSITINNIN